ncbi:MAG: DUF2339 domain-containing protein [Arachnia sp.]
MTVLWSAGAVVALRFALRRPAWSRQLVRLGLGLSIAAVLKLFLLDLSALTPLVRAVAFIGTGVLLLVVGLQYAKAFERVASAVADRAPAGPGSPTPGTAPVLGAPMPPPPPGAFGPAAPPPGASGPPVGSPGPWGPPGAMGPPPSPPGAGDPVPYGPGQPVAPAQWQPPQITAPGPEASEGGTGRVG